MGSWSSHDLRYQLFPTTDLSATFLFLPFDHLHTFELFFLLPLLQLLLPRQKPHHFWTMGCHWQVFWVCPRILSKESDHWTNTVFLRMEEKTAPRDFSKAIMPFICATWPFTISNFLAAVAASPGCNKSSEKDRRSLGILGVGFQANLI